MITSAVKNYGAAYVKCIGNLETTEKKKNKQKKTYFFLVQHNVNPGKIIKVEKKSNGAV